jgi:polyhydroxyalkanoate synthase
VVIGQSPPAGESVPAGAAVDLTVSAGPATEEDHANEDGNEDERRADVDAETGETHDVGLRDVDGIGPTYADRLRAVGVDDLPSLLASDPAEVADVTRASRSRVEGWFEQAKRLLEGA